MMAFNRGRTAVQFSMKKGQRRCRWLQRQQHSRDNVCSGSLRRVLLALMKDKTKGFGVVIRVVVPAAQGDSSAY